MFKKQTSSNNKKKETNYNVLVKKMTVFQKSFECYLIYNSLHLRIHNFLSNMTRKFRALQVTGKKNHSDSGNWVTVKLVLARFHKSFVFSFSNVSGFYLHVCIPCAQSTHRWQKRVMYPWSWSYRQLRAATCVLGI